MNSSRKRTYLKVFLNLGISLCILLVCVFLLPRIIIWFMPFVTGWIIALIASPLVHFFEKRLKIRRKAGTAFVIISVIALVILAGYLIGAQLVEQIAEFIGAVPKLWEAAQEDFA